MPNDPEDNPSPPHVVMPSRFDALTAEGQIRELASKSAALERMFRRVLGLDDEDALSKEDAKRFRSAIEYAVSMDARKVDTERLLACVLRWETTERVRKSSWSKSWRTMLTIIATAAVGAAVTHYFGK